MEASVWLWKVALAVFETPVALEELLPLVAGPA
jgi:hypothetical protein